MKKLLFVFLFCSFLLLPLVNAQSIWPFFNGNPQHTGLSPYDTNRIMGAIKWSYLTGDGVESSPVVADDGTIYVGSHDAKLYAFNSNGTLKWSFAAGTPVYNDKWKRYAGIISTPAIGNDNTVYFIAPDNYLHAVKDGKETWKFAIQWEGISFWDSPMIAPDGTIYVGSARSDLSLGSTLTSGFYAINPNGTEKWHYEISAGVTSTPAFSQDGGTIYVNGNIKRLGDTSGGTDAYLFAFTKEGILKWKFKFQDWVETSPSVGDDGTIYTGSKEGRVYALNSDGTKKWEFAAGDGIGGTPALGKDGTIYVGSWDSKFYSFASTILRGLARPADKLTR
ncbi:MAG: PQQ-binding-like beta-propeller repeat protein [Candidatus Diapherotrites archaeon]|nr:PQQ-binding-like beta-propeller repeat protein [Candidatus Diapherotrites archaeon]